MLRVKRFAAAIDMIAAGTRPPMPMAAKATPANQSGKECRMSAGHREVGLVLSKLRRELRQLVDAGGQRHEAESAPAARA